MQKPREEVRRCAISPFPGTRVRFGVSAAVAFSIARIHDGTGRAWSETSQNAGAPRNRNSANRLGPARGRLGGRLTVPARMLVRASGVEASDMPRKGLGET